MAAGLGFKDFVTGEVLTAADVDGYLMQGIWVFASAAARNAAVTSPQEGNACYLKDTDVIQVYSGSSWVTKSGGSPLTTKGDLYTFSTSDARLGVGANGTTLVADSSEATGLKWATPAAGGKVLQVVSATTTTQTAITSTTMTDSGLSVSITPSSATSKVLILVSQQVQVERNNTAQSAGWRLLRGATMVYDGDGSLSRGFLIVTNDQTELAYSQFASIVYLDNPATTSATTYKTQGKVEVTTNSSTIRFQHNSCMSSIIALEIGA